MRRLILLDRHMVSYSVCVAFCLSVYDIIMVIYCFYYVWIVKVIINLQGNVWCVYLENTLKKLW